MHGTEGVHFYTRGKAVTSRWLDPSHGGVNLGFPVNSLAVTQRSPSAEGGVRRHPARIQMSVIRTALPFVTER